MRYYLDKEIIKENGSGKYDYRYTVIFTAMRAVQVRLDACRYETVLVDGKAAQFRVYGLTLAETETAVSFEAQAFLRNVLSVPALEGTAFTCVWRDAIWDGIHQRDLITTNRAHMTKEDLFREQCPELFAPKRVDPVAAFKAVGVAFCDFVSTGKPYQAYGTTVRPGFIASINEAGDVLFDDADFPLIVLADEIDVPAGASFQERAIAAHEIYKKEIEKAEQAGWLE